MRNQPPTVAMRLGFAAAFWRVLASQPVRALGALYWHVTGRKVRARNRLRIGLSQGANAYRFWVQEVEDNGAVVAAAEAVMARWTTTPLFSVLVSGVDQVSFDGVMAQMRAQTYPRWELIVVPYGDDPIISSDDPRVHVTDRVSVTAGDALRIASEHAKGNYLLPLAPGATLPPTALFRYAEALQEASADMLFGDCDEIDRDGQRLRPWFKPQWNTELALAQDYVSQALLVSASAGRRAFADGLLADRAPIYALALAVGCREGAIVGHVPHVQAHLATDAETPSQDDRVDAVNAQLAGMGAAVSAGPHGTVRVDWPLPDPLPLVSIIVPTRDRVDLLRACLSTLEAQTAYRPFEVIVVDNGSERPETMAYLDEIDRRDGFRVIRDERPYNYAQLNNLAVSQAEGDYICLLNNDTEVIGSDWLTAMMRQAVRPHVGAVGARLLYDDGSIQHAGVAIGIGEAAAHAHRFQSREAPGYFARTHAAHYVSAVTAACLVVQKSKFLAVGGLDEQNFAVAFNDVDLCLKLQRAGWRNVYTPHATLMHHESKSRGKDFSPAHIDRYRRELGMLQERWGTRDYVDPLHHVHLDRASETFLIRL